MPYTDSELLTQWQTARDRIVDAIAAGDPVVEYQIGSRRVRREASMTLLKEVQSQIKALTLTTSTYPARTYARRERL